MIFSSKKQLMLITFITLILLVSQTIFAGVLQSRAYCVIDTIDTNTYRVIKQKNIYKRLPPASTVKLLTAMVVIDHIPLDRQLTTSRRASLVSPTKLGLKEGERLSCKDLLMALLIKSANDSAIILAEGVAGSVDKFMELMNKKAKNIGCQKSVFKTPNGLPHSGQYTCAYDMALIALRALKYKKIQEILKIRQATIVTSTGHNIWFGSHNKLLWRHKGIIYGKTGYTNKARNTFAGFTQKEGRWFIVSLLGAPKRKIMWKELLYLLDYKEHNIKKTPKNIQTILQKLGYYNGKIDGLLGPKSKNAVKLFQKKNGLMVDGIVGSKTWNAMKSKLDE